MIPFDFDVVTGPTGAPLRPQQRPVPGKAEPAPPSVPAGAAREPQQEPPAPRP